MKKTELLVLLSKLKRAYYKLKEAVNSDIKSELERDGVIQRFEFTFDIFWKTLKIILRYKGIECFSPRDCIKIAFRNNIIPDDEIFLDMLEDRNLTSHIYDDDVVIQIFQRVKIYTVYIERAIEKIEREL